MKVYNTKKILKESQSSANTLTDPKVRIVEENIGKNYLVQQDLYFDGEEWRLSNSKVRENEKIPQGSILTLEFMFKDTYSDIDDISVSLKNNSENDLDKFDMNVYNAYELITDPQSLKII